jgi:hypothetical protein
MQVVRVFENDPNLPPRPAQAPPPGHEYHRESPLWCPRLGRI